MNALEAALGRSSVTLSWGGVFSRERAKTKDFRTTDCDDSRPWLTHNPRASLVVAILRRVVYTLLALFRSVTQRSETRRQMAWKRLLAEVLYACHTLASDTLRSLRRHRLPPDSAKGVTD